MIDPTTNPGLATGSTSGSSTPVGTSPQDSLDASTGMRTSTGNGHDRVHRLAGTMHRAIDSVEQRLGSAGGGMSSARGRYGEQARQYRDRLGTRMNEQPLQVAGIVLAAGVLIDRLLLRKPRVRWVQVPVRTHAAWDAEPVIERHAQRWSDAADAHLQRVRRTGREAVDKAHLAAASGIAGIRSGARHLEHEAQALPLQMRMAAQRLMARSQAYGSMARSQVEAHPWAGLGAVLAASGLLTTVLMRRRDPAPQAAYVTVDERGRGAGWQRSEYDTQTGLGDMIASRPVTSSVLVLGLGMLAGLLLRRRME